MSELRDKLVEKLDWVLKDLYEDGLNAHTLHPSSNTIELHRKVILAIPELARALELLEKISKPTSQDTMEVK